MGTFSLRSLRSDIQNVTMRKHRSCPSLTKFVAGYLFACAVVYIYYRHYLLNEGDYTTPLPADVPCDEMLRPIETFSSGKDSSLPNSLLEAFYKGKLLKKRSGFYDIRWHQSKHDKATPLEDDLSLGELHFYPTKGKISETRDPVASSVTELSFNVSSKINNSSEDFDKQRNANLRKGKISAKNDNIYVTDPTYDAPNMEDSYSQIRVNHNSLVTSKRFQDFRRDWFRQRRARVDWKRMIKPCLDNMEWGRVKNNWGKINRSSARASEVLYQDIRPAGEFSKIFIQSKTADNRTKRIGGDTWRVYVHGPSSVASTLFDHENGTYEALFLLTEPGNYHLMIYLDYSLCDGFKDPPRDWFIIGNAQGKYQKEGLLGTLDEYLLEPFKDGDPVIINVPDAHFNATFTETLQNGLGSCSESCNHLWDGFGRWVKTTWRPYIEESTGWSLPLGYQRNGSLWIYGDSLALRLMHSARDRLLCRTLYKRCLHSYNWIYPVGDEARSKKEDDDLDFSPGRVIDDILKVLQEPYMQTEESMLFLNLGLHFPIGINFTTYQRLFQDLIHSLKETEVDSLGIRVPKYKAKVIWKTSTAIRKEKASAKNMTHWRFFTTQRVALFSAYSMSAMCEAGFDVIDVYPMTDSYPGGTEDVVHYPNHVFNAVEKLLEKYKANKNKRLEQNEKKSRIKRCIG